MGMSSVRSSGGVVTERKSVKIRKYDAMSSGEGAIRGGLAARDVVCRLISVGGENLTVGRKHTVLGQPLKSTGGGVAESKVAIVIRAAGVKHRSGRVAIHDSFFSLIETCTRYEHKRA